jgi:uncharacterized protein YcfL
MKKLLTLFLLVLICSSFTGCNSKGSSLSVNQRKAVDNSVEFISNSSFTSQDRIDTDIIEIKNATENTWKSVWYEGSKIEENAIELNDWVITIGSTSDHGFAIIVCDSNNYEVIGYIPID